MPANDPKPSEAFIAELHRLHRRAGKPSYAEMSRSLGNEPSPDTIANIFNGKSMSRWTTIEKVTQILLDRGHVPESVQRQHVDRVRSLWLNEDGLGGTTQLSELPRLGQRRSREDYDPLTTTSGWYVHQRIDQIDEHLDQLSMGAPADWAVLVVRRGPTAGQLHLIERELRAGRHPDSEAFLDDSSVSRRHALFTTHAGIEAKWAVVDEGSLNGTYVNRQRIEKPTALKTGAFVQIGRFRLVFIDLSAWGSLSDDLKEYLVEIDEPAPLPPGD